MRLLSCDEMKKVESCATNFGLSFQKMMENAGTACARYIRSVIENNEYARNVTIVCGKGNNGGDGFVIARKLAEIGYKITVIMVAGYPTGRDAEFMYKMIKDISIPVIWYDADPSKALNAIKSAKVLVDAVFGFSFYGTVEGDYAEVFRAVNASSALIFSVDLPSGTYCDSGQIDPNCIIADHTIAISSLKPAHIIHPAADCCGDIYIANIGIPKESYNIVKNSMYTLSIAEIPNLLPRRSETANKGDFGHLLVISGSRKMPGACALAVKAALRSGTGLVTAAFPEGLREIMANKLTEALLFPLAENEEGAISADALPGIISELDRFSGILIGPGLSVCDDTRKLVRDIIRASTVPLVLDADALNIISEDPSIFADAKAPLILTPHPKEMSRLCNAPVSFIQSNRIKFAKDFASIKNAFVILKGSNTVVASPTSDGVYVNASGNNGMAKGGSGDVLAGIVASLAAQGISVMTACNLAVFIHGRCGDKAADRLSRIGMLPSDMIDELSSIWREYE